eukprot:TRINITY_DN9425_c0_g1_i2.p1 TRINITY_DN9425_c0_g1~~TRINITY_DN9425_c0_g1_i2.p1  ORF type:complete len:906 (+),score=153.57 TRINITY_DN9425_c0_g1_i2:137-2854(+)
MSGAESIFVGMRLRPFVSYERDQQCCIEIENDTVNLVPAVLGDRCLQCKSWRCDAAMDSTDPNSPSYCDQVKVYELMGRRILDHTFGGYNSCLFCYGQTGTGKTTTIMGRSEPVSEQGLLLRLLHELFEKSDELEATGCSVNVSVQVVEVYNERIQDLVAPSCQKSGKPRVEACVHPSLGVYMKGATSHSASNLAECLRIIEYGNTMKTVAATAMNPQSSRGHMVVKVGLAKKGGTDNINVNSEVFFVDLAGRENEKTTQVTGDRFVELSFINSSLMWLALCIQSLCPYSGVGGPRKAVCGATMTRKPTSTNKKIDMSKFRNSKLTLLLANALTGNSRTSMIGTLSPALANFEESLTTLKFAATIKNIKLEAIATASVDDAALVGLLRKELDDLRQQLSAATCANQLAAAVGLCDEDCQSTDTMESLEMKNKLGISEWRLLAWNGRHSMLTSGAAASHGITSLPFLASYSTDPQLAFNLVMHVPSDGIERDIGTGTACEVRLPPALGVEALMCHMLNENGKLIVRGAPMQSEKQSPLKRHAPVEVNGVTLAEDSVTLHDRDYIVFGCSLVFFNFETPIKPSDYNTLGEKLHAHIEMANDEELLIKGIIGQERASDNIQVDAARQAHNLMKSRHVTRERSLRLHAFLLRMRAARQLIDQANELTQVLRPTEHLRFELLTQAPALGFGFPETGNLPELVVRLVHEVPKARRLWRTACRDVVGVARALMDKVQQSAPPSRSKEFSIPTSTFLEVIHTFSWEKFTQRLELLRHLHSQWLEDPTKFTIEPFADPWHETDQFQFPGVHQACQTKDTHDEESEAYSESLLRQVEATVQKVTEREQQLAEELGAVRRFKQDIVERAAHFEVKSCNLHGGLSSCTRIGLLNEDIVSHLRCACVKAAAATGETPI